MESVSHASRSGKRQRGSSRRASRFDRTSASLSSSLTLSKQRVVQVKRRDQARHTGIGVSGSRASTPWQDCQSHVICAISENLARETCVVSIDLACPVILNVTKQHNGQNYAETLSCLSLLSPNEILMNEGRLHSPLAEKIREHCRYRKEAIEQVDENDCSANSAVLKFISRAFFDQTKGADMLRRLARSDTYDSKALVQEYILLSSAHAVLHYAQKSLDLAFTNNCLSVRTFLAGGSDENPRIMDIDRATLVYLELLSNSSPGSGKATSLISSIDCTRTSVGNRLLRSTIMAPPCRSATIHARLELVETFLSSEQLFYSILKQLHNLNPIDKMLSDIVMIPIGTKRLALDTKSGESAVSLSVADTNSVPSMQKGNAVNAKLAQKGIASLVGIKTTLSCIPLIASTLKNHLDTLDGGINSEKDKGEFSVVTGKSSLMVGLGVGDFEGHQTSASGMKSSHAASRIHQGRQHLLRAIIFALSQPELEEIRDEISDALRGNTAYSRSGNAARHQECFALKSSTDCFGMIDIIRKAFLTNVDEIYKKADEYAEVHGIYVTVKYTAAKGYYLSLPASCGSELPEIFIQPARSGSGSFIHCTTDEIQSLNLRAQDNIRDLLTLTHERIQRVLDFARSKYDALALVSDAIGLLDLCHAFADKVTLSKESWVPPILIETDSRGNSGEDTPTLCIRNGRCVIDEDALQSAGHTKTQMVVNDTYCGHSNRFTVISGVNGSGKSTYLKQVARIVLLAHCGSYVPASEALIPLTTRLCARMGSSDDLENNVSSFMKEMKETAFICKNATSRSLMLLDELGRETSNEDGVALAWSVAERLLSTGAITFFATHYPQICQLSRVYPSVKNQHLESTLPRKDNGSILYTYKIRNGPCLVSSNYGIHVAASTGFPDDVVDQSREIEHNIKGLIASRSGLDWDYEAASQERKQLKEFAKKIYDFVDSANGIQCLRSGLKMIQDEIVATTINVKEANMSGKR